jgi:hypothetical protein
VLLILDGHSTHTKSLEVIDLPREKGVILLCLPPHTSHRLQPLDVSFFKPLSLYYGEELRKWLRCNSGKIVTLWQISSIFGAAFIQSATMKTALKGFEKTGIWPPNKNIFPESYFLPSDTTDIRLETEQLPAISETNKPNTIPNIENSNEVMVAVNEPMNISGSNNPQTDSSQNVEDPISPQKHSVEPQQGCSFWKDSPEKVLTPAGKTTFNMASPELILRIPKATRKNIKRTVRKKGKTVVLTESPYKNELEEEKRKKEEQEKKKEKAKPRLFKNKEFQSGNSRAKKSIHKRMNEENKEQIDKNKCNP